MKRLFQSIPLSAKLMLIGLVPSLLVVYLFINLSAEKARKVRLLKRYEQQIQESSDITKLITHLQEERNISYDYALNRVTNPRLAMHRAQTDSLIRMLSTRPELENFPSYTFLEDLQRTRFRIDSNLGAPNDIVHFYTTSIFRLNTLNNVPPTAAIYFPGAYADLVSQKLLSDLGTYMGIAVTNFYTALYTRQYVTEILIGTLGTYQVFQSYERELLTKGSPATIASYRKLRSEDPVKATMDYLDSQFKKFSIDSTYTAAEWRAVSGAALAGVGALQQQVLNKVETELKTVIQKEQAAKEKALIWLIVVFAVVLALVCYIIYFINRSLRLLRRHAEVIARGRTGIDQRHMGSDVIGKLADSIYMIDESQRALAIAATSIGKGEFDTPVPIRSRGDILGNAIIEMTKGLQQWTKAEKEIAHLAAIVQNSQDAIISKTLDEIVTSWNPGAEKLFGYKAEEMIGKSILQIIPPDRTEEELMILERLRNGQSVEHFETQRMHKSGAILDISLTISPIRDSKGNVVGVSKIGRDITERLQDRRRIEEGEDRLRIAIQATNLGTWDYHPMTGSLSWSDECRKIYELPKDVEITFELFSELIYPADRHIAFAAIESAMDPGGNGDYNTTYRIVRYTDQRVRWIRAQGKVYFTKEKNPERFIGTVIDITEQKQAQNAIEESEHRTRLAIEAAKLGTFEWDLVSNAFTGSERLNEIFGYPGEEKINHLKLIAALHPDDKPARDKAVEQSAEKGSLSYEARVIWPNNDIRWVKVYGKVLYGESGQAQRMYGTVMDITEEKQSMEALAENEQRLQVALEAGELGTWELNLVTRAIKYSDRYLEILGFPTNASPTHPEILSRISPEDMEMRSAAIAKALETGRLDFETRIRPDGENIRWIRSIGKVLYDQKQVPVRLLGITMDVTDEKLAFNSLLESEERFKIIANTAPVMIWMSGNDRFADFFNISWLTFRGRTMAQESGDGWLEGVHPDDVKHCVDMYTQSFAKQSAFSIEYRLRRHDGRYRWISDNAVPRVTPEGKFIGFISACRDVEDEKTFNEKLLESELLFKTITNVSPVGLWMTDAEGNNNFVNDTWIDWTGITQQDQHGRGWTDSVIPDDREKIGQTFRECFKNKKPFSAEFRMTRKDGQLRWVLSEGSPFYDINEQFAGYAGSVTDITERKHDEMRKNDFLAVASHELKTPLTSVKAYAQLLSVTYEKSNDTFLKNALGKVDNQVNKMTKLVGDFLNLSKIESDKFELNKEEFDLSALAREVAADMQVVSLNHSIVVEKSAPVYVTADRDKIAQVITNFLTNAVKYSPTDKNVQVSVTGDNGVARLTVSDRGIGIQPEEQERIFERFYRSRFNNNIAYSGFGIGLYISAEIIRLHNGEIGVTSEFGKGASFYFALPD